MRSTLPSPNIFRYLSIGTLSIAALTFFLPIFLRTSPPRLGCEAPIPYNIGNVDPRFPLGKDAVRKTAQEAEAVWEHGLGKDVLVYDPEAAFSIVAIFDERQKMSGEASELKQSIASYEKTSGEAEKKHAKLLAEYRSKARNFEARVKRFNSALETYNAEVEKWNKEGGAPEEEYAELEKNRKELEEEEREIKREGAALEKLADTTNGLADTLKSQTDTVNGNIAKFQERYGDPRPFVQGLYTPPLQSIEIFQFEGKDDLRLVIAHEFGHALGIEEHVSNDRSLMHYLMGGQDLLSPRLTAEDIAAYDIACPDRSFSSRERIVRYFLHTPLQEMDFLDVLGIVLKKSP